jgi:uncharacterized protein (DUF58 family)
MGKGLKYSIGSLLFFLMLAIINGGKLFYLLTFMVSLTLLLSFLILRFNVKQLISAFYINERIIHVGDPISIEYKLANNGLLPIMMAWVHIRISKKLGNMDYAPEILFFKPLQMISIKKDLMASHRGYYQVGSLEVVLTDPFGLFKQLVTYGKDIDLTVYPKVTELDRIRLKPSEFFGSIKVSENTHEDFTSIRNIRNYQYGDSIKRIHWKQSAKSEALLVKEFDLSANTKVSMILDGFKGNALIDECEEVEEKLVEVCASLSKYFLKNDIETSVLVTSKNHMRLNGKNMDRLEDVFKELIGFTSDGDVDIHKIFSSEYKKLTFGSTIYLMTPELNTQLIDALIAASRKSIRVTVINVLTESQDFVKYQEQKQMLSTHSVQVHLIFSDQDIRQVLEV